MCNHYKLPLYDACQGIINFAWPVSCATSFNNNSDRQRIDWVGSPQYPADNFGIIALTGQHPAAGLTMPTGFSPGSSSPNNTRGRVRGSQGGELTSFSIWKGKTPKQSIHRNKPDATLGLRYTGRVEILAASYATLIKGSKDLGGAISPVLFVTATTWYRPSRAQSSHVRNTGDWTIRVYLLLRQTHQADGIIHSADQANGVPDRTISRRDFDCP